MNKFTMLLIVLSIINLVIGIFTGNFSAICGWLCALFAQIQLYVFQGD